MSFPSQVPDAGTPIFDERGYISPVWHQFFFTLLNRTGGTEGTEPVSAVIGEAPITSTGGGKPVIGINPATEGTAGSLSAEDKTKLDTVAAGAKVSAVTATLPIVSSGGASPNISIGAATATDDGSMSASDKNKLDGISAGAAIATVTATSPIASTGGQNPIISIAPATGASPGSMSGPDKAKLDLINYATGTWIPQITFDTPGNLAVTYSEQSGTYTRIGRMVFINFSVSTSSFTFTTASGNLMVNGVPLPSGVATRVNGALDFSGITIPGYTNFNTWLLPGSSVVYVIASASGASRSLVSAANTPSGGNVYLSGTLTYYV